jgi:hypothetical protein
MPILKPTPMRRRPGTRHIPARVQKLKAGKRLRLGAKRKTPPSSRTGLEVDPLRHLKSPASPTVSQTRFQRRWQVLSSSAEKPSHPIKRTMFMASDAMKREREC